MAKRPDYRLKPKLEKTCDVCGKKFITAFSKWKRCSKECGLKWHRFEYIKYIWPYGITSKEYNEMFNKQEGCCKLCKTHQSDLKAKLNIDHNHMTDEVRGLLCNQCNQALGLIKENPSTLKNMLEYVS